MASLPPLFVEIPRSPVTAVGLPLALGVFTTFVTRESRWGPKGDWYPKLKKAKGQPPNWAFPVVWSGLFSSMGWCSHLIIQAYDRAPPGSELSQKAALALKLYYGQLVFNQLWTPLSFGLGQLGIAFADLVSLTVTLGVSLTVLPDVDETAALLTVPYVAWSAYATYLSGSLWYLNGGKDWIKSFFGGSKPSLPKA